MNEFMQPQLLNNMDMQPQQEQKNMEQMNQNLMMGPQGDQQMQGNQQMQGDQQMQGNNLQASLLRTEAILQPVDANAVRASQVLDRAAEVEFKEGIDSRPGSCERRKTKNRKALARNAISDYASKRGLTKYSGKLSNDLVDARKQEEAQQETSNEFYDKWVKTGVGKFERGREGDDGYVSVEEKKNEDAAKIPLLGWLKDDRSRGNLLSGDAMLQSRAYEELLDRALAFQLQPNAMCTLPAMKRAAEVMRFAPLVNNLYTQIGKIHTSVYEQIPPYKFKQFDKFYEVFGHLQQGTEAAAQLQGINADGTTRHSAYSVMTRDGKKRDIEKDYGNSKKQRNRSSAAYERELARYNAAYGDKEALRRQRLAFIEQSSGAPLSEQVYDIKRGLSEAKHVIKETIDLISERKQALVGSAKEKESAALMKSASSKRELGGVLTDDEKKVMVNSAFISAMRLPDYTETQEEREMLYNKNPELRAVHIEKIIDRMLQKLPQPLSADPSVYSSAKDMQAAVKMKPFVDEIGQISVILETDPLSAQHVSAEKTEQMKQWRTIITHLSDYENASTCLMGITEEGKLYNGKICLSDMKNYEKADNKRLTQLQSEKAEQYKQAAQLYNEYYENSDPQSKKKIAEARELLGTDLGATKHTLDMAESLQGNQMAPLPFLQLRSFEGIGRMLSSSVTEQQSEAQAMLMDKLMAFPLDAAQVSLTPDMENIPEIIAHGRLVDQLQRELDDNKAAAKLLPADKLAQWEEFTQVFTTLRDTAAIAVGRVGLTVQGTSRYAEKPGITPEELAADKSQLSNAYTDGRTKLELLGRGYAAKYLADEETKQQAKEAEKLLGTSLGITKESYKLATALQGNQKQAETNAAADKKWFVAWSETEEGKRQIADGNSVEEKKAAHASKLKELKQEEADVRSAALKQWHIENPGHKNAKPNISNVPAVKAINEKLAAHGNSYVPTEEEAKQLPLSAHKSAAQVLHLVEDDDKAKLFSDDPKLRAEVLTAMAEKLIADGLDKNQLTDPALVQKLPALLAKEKDAKALKEFMYEDKAVSKLIMNDLVAAVNYYAELTRRVGQAAPHILHGHGLTVDGNSLYKDNQPKDAQDYRRMKADGVLHELYLMEVEEKYANTINNFIDRKNSVAEAKEKQAQEKLEKERLEKKKEQDTIAWETALREQLKKQFNGDALEKAVEAAKKERSDFDRRKDMSPQDAYKDMVEDSKKWLANWEESEEGKAYKKQHGAYGGSRVMTQKQTAEATKLAHLLTDAQRIKLFSTGSSMRASVELELYHIIMGDTELKKNAPQEERNKVKVQQEVAKLATIENAKALLRLTHEENYNFITPKKIEEMMELLR